MSDASGDYTTPTAVGATSGVTLGAFRREIVFVDARVGDLTRLRQALPAHLDMVVLEAGQDGVARIAQVLARYRQESGGRTMDAVHVISHGGDGQVFLGTSTLSNDTLVDHGTALQRWGEGLADRADLLFYGCDIAASADGTTLMDRIARATGADVAASDDPTGARRRGGDWELEYRIGAIETDVVFSVEAQQSLQNVLLNNPPTFVDQAFFIDENPTFTQNIGTIAASDVDGDTLTLSFPVWQEARTPFWHSTSSPFQVNAQFPTLLDYEGDATQTGYDPVAHQFVYTVRVTDNGAGNLFTDATITINLNDVAEVGDDDPVIGGFASPTFSEDTLNAGAQILDATATLTDASSADFNGGYLTVYYNSGWDAAHQLWINSEGDAPEEINVSGTTGQTGATVAYGGSTFATIKTSGAGTGYLIVAFDTATATQEAVQALLRNLTFQTSSHTPGTTRQLNMRISDGDGGISTVVAPIITVTADNDAPTLTTLGAELGTVDENTQATITLAQLTAQGDEADVDGTVDAFVVQAISSGALKIGATAGTATDWVANTNDTIDATNNAYWTGDANASGLLNAFTVVAKDDGGAESATPIQVVMDVTEVNSPPTGTDVTLTTVEDASLVLSTASFGYSDADADTMASVKITTLASAGSLQHNGGTWVDVTQNQVVTTADLEAGKLRFVPNANANGAPYATLQFTVHDGTVESVAANTLTLHVSSVNDPPTLSRFAAPVATVDEDSEATLTLADLKAQGDESDLDDAVNAFVVRSVGAGTLRIGTDADSATAWQAGSNDTVDSARNAYWIGAEHTNGLIDAFSVMARDSGGVRSAVVVPVPIQVTAVNDLPLFEDQTLTVPENSPFATVVGTLVVSDPEGDALTLSRLDTPLNRGFVVQTTSHETHETREITVGAPTLLDYENDPVQVGYDADNHRYQMTLRAAETDDPSRYTDAVITIDVTDVEEPGANQDPTLGGWDSVTFSESGLNAAAQVVDADVTLADADSVHLNGGYLLLHDPAGSSDTEQLWVRHQGTEAGQIGLSHTAVGVVGTTLSYGGVTMARLVSTGRGETGLVVAFEGDAATPEAVEALIENITYHNTSDTPSSTRQLTLQVSDGDGGIAVAETSTLTIVPDNDVPTLTAFAAPLATIEEDTQATLTWVDLVALGDEADVDDSVEAFVVQAVSSGTLAIGETAETATPWVAGTHDTLDATHHAYWRGASDANGDLEAFTVVARDGGGGVSSTPVPVSVSVTAVNDAPTMTALAGTVMTVAEDTLGTVTAAQILAQADEADVDGTVETLVVREVSSGTLRIGATDATATAWVAGDNDILDATHHAYWRAAEDANGILTAFTVVARDEDGASSTTAVPVSVDVTPVNDAPRFENQTFTLPENAPFLFPVGSAVASDVDGDTLTFARLDPASGVGFAIGTDTPTVTVRFPTLMDYENDPVQVGYDSDAHRYQMTIRATDDGVDPLYTDAVITVVLTDADETGHGDPVLQGWDAVTFNENTLNTAAQVLDAEVLFSDPDSADLAGGSLVLRADAGWDDDDRWSVRHQGDAAGQIGVDGTTLSYGGVAFATFQTAVNSADEMIITFDTVAATPEAVDALIQNLTYQTLSDTPAATRTLNLQISDGDGGMSVALLSTVTVVPEDERPTLTRFTAPLATVDEDSLVELNFATLQAQGDEADGDGTVEAFVVQTVGAGTLTLGSSAEQATAWEAETHDTIDADTHAYWRAAEHAYGTFDLFSVVAQDNSGYTSPTPVMGQVVVTAVNDAPVFSQLDGAPTFVEGGVSVPLDGDVTIADREHDAAGHYDGATLTLERQGGRHVDDQFLHAGTLAPLSAGGNLMVDDIIVGAVTAHSDGMMVWTFNQSATTALVNRALQQLHYVNGSDAPDATVPIAWVFEDGNAEGAQGSGGSLRATGLTTVAVTPVTTLTITSDRTALRMGEQATVTWRFSEPPVGFVPDDVVTVGGEMGHWVETADPRVYQATLTPTPNVDAGVVRVTVAEGQYTDAAGNRGAAAGLPDMAVDTRAPTVTAITFSDPAVNLHERPIVTFRFREAVQGLTTADVVVPHGTLGTPVSGDGGVTWTAAFTPAAQVEAGDQRLALNIGDIRDLAGNVGAGVVLSNPYGVHTQPPVERIEVSDTVLMVGETARVTFTFDKAVTGLEGEDVILRGGQLSEVISTEGGLTWTATFSPDHTVANGVMTLAEGAVQDLEGNRGLGGRASNAYAVYTHAQLASLSRTQLSHLAATDMGMMTTTQVASLTSTQIGMLTTAQVQGWGSVAMAALTTGQMGGVTTAQLASLTTTQFAALEPENVHVLRPAQVRALTSAQVAAMTTDHIANLRTLQMRVLSTAQVVGLSASDLTALRVTQVRALGPQAVASLTTTQMAGLTGGQIGALARVQLGALTTIQLSALTTTQMEGIRAEQIRALSTIQVVGLTGEQIAAWSPRQVRGLTVAQLAVLTTTQLRGLSATAVAELGMAQVRGLPHAVVAAWTTTQSAALSSRQVSALTTGQIENLSSTHLAEWTSGQVAGLTMAQMGALTTTQLAVLRTCNLSHRQLRALTPIHVAALTVSQVACLSSTQIRPLRTAQVAGLTATQVAWLAPTQVGALRYAHVQSLSVTQVAALAPEDMAVLAPRQIRAFTTAQMAAWTTAHLGAMDAAAVAAWTPRQVGALTPTQVSALTSHQVANLVSEQIAALTTAHVAT